jgi:parvulin-like peptidyl-prolyl isomerase
MARLIGLSIDSEQVIDHLKHEVKLKTVYRDILCQQIVEQASQERGITVEPEEVQAEADQFRYEHKLESAAQTLAWLEDQLLTPDDWEAGIHERLLTKKLAETLFGKQLENHFSQSKVQYEQAVLYRIVVPYNTLAQEIFYQVEEEEISFFEAAHLYDVDEHRRLACGFEGKVSRWQLKPDVAARVFGTAPREIIGPLQTDEQFELMMVEEFIPAKLTPEVRQQILDQLFNEWLESELNYLRGISASTHIAPDEHLDQP